VAKLRFFDCFLSFFLKRLLRGGSTTGGLAESATLSVEAEAKLMKLQVGLFSFSVIDWWSKFKTDSNQKLDIGRFVCIVQGQ